MKTENNFDLKQGRVLSGKTQVELASELGITPEYLSMLERGVKKPSKKVIDKFKMVCETSTNYDSGQHHAPNIIELARKIESLETDVALLKKLILK